jgi:hypothetical protein
VLIGGAFEMGYGGFAEPDRESGYGRGPEGGLEVGAGNVGCAPPCDPADGARGGGVEDAEVAVLLILSGATVELSGVAAGLFMKSSSSGLPCFCCDILDAHFSVGA